MSPALERARKQAIEAVLDEGAELEIRCAAVRRLRDLGELEALVRARRLWEAGVLDDPDPDAGVVG